MKILVLRLGAYGDLIFATPLLKKLKEEGHYITIHARKPQFDAVLKGNPNVDKVIYHDPQMPNSHLDAYWAELSKNYDRTINLTGTIEDRLLMREGTIGFSWKKEQRHALCNINYYDATMMRAGYRYNGNGELFFSPLETREAKKIRRKHAGKYLILWSMSGSSFHKTYPYQEYVMKKIVNTYPDTVILAVGDVFCSVFEAGLIHPQIKNYVNKWSMRKTLSMLPHVDLVVGTETGVLVGAGCYDVPKVIMLSHSSEDNLTFTWSNVTNVVAVDAPCRPCHRLIYTKWACELEPGLDAPICMGKIPPKVLYNAIVEKYQEKKNGIVHRSGDEAILRGGRRDVVGLGEKVAAV